MPIGRFASAWRTPLSFLPNYTLFFYQGDCIVPQKILALEAILRATVLYGLDTLTIPRRTH
eukprot:9265622-Prorocentrum_lima.AAC.1